MAAQFPLDPEKDREIAGLGSLTPENDVEFDVEPDKSEVQVNKDGSASLIEAEGDIKKTEHQANLAEELPEEEMEALATELLRRIENDKESRKRRDEQYEEGLKRSGLGKDAPGGAPFDGASRVVHPMLAEGCVDFAASSMKELFPPNGPAKAKIEGEATEEKLTISKRQERYLNWQLTEQISEYADELEQTLTQVPMGGSQYMKFWMDGEIKRITCEFVPVDDVYLPFTATDFYSASRITHAQHLSGFTYEDRVETGFYRDIGVGLPGPIEDQTKSAKANEKIEGKEETGENVDDERVVLEVNTYANISIDENKKAPYLISIDETSGKVVSIYRNWNEDDPKRKRLEWMVEYGFISWRGAYKIGLPHLIGGLSAAATGALRALLDSAHVNTMPGFLRQKGLRFGGQTKSVDPMQGIEVEGGVGDDIRKLILPLPYNQPSPVLYQLLGWLTDAAKGVVTTAEEKIADANSQMPMGTALALIEQGAKVFSSIFARLHRSQRRALQIIGRLNAEYVSTEEQMERFGEVLATREDFARPLAVSPVSDPNIFSDAQRYAQMQMVLSMATQPATAPLHNLYSTIKRIYEIAKIPDIETFLPKPKQPIETNAAAENSAVMMGSPILAFPEQDHLAHIEVHMRFITDPFLGSNPSAAPKSMPMMMEHIKQHLSFLYAQLMFELATEASGADLGQALKGKQGQAVDQLLAAASRHVHDQLTKVLAPLGPQMDQIIKQIAQMQPPMPMDPSQAAITAAKMDKESKDQAAFLKKQSEDAKLAQRAQVDAGKGQIDQAKVGLEAERVQNDKQKDDADIINDQLKLQAQIQHQEMQLQEDAEKGNQIAGA